MSEKSTIVVRMIPSVRALIFDSQKRLLLVAGKESVWHTPGGWVDNFEVLPEAMRREVFEELGLEVEVGELVAVSQYFVRAENNPFNENVNKIENYFMCNVIKGSIEDEWTDYDQGLITQKRFFSKDEILNLKDRVVPEFVKDGRVFDVLEGYLGYIV